MLRRIIFRDLGTKALALVLALAIYGHVFSSQEREMTFRIPLRLRAIPAGLVQVGDVPPDAHIRVRARGRDLLRLRTRSFSAEVHLDAPAEGRLQRPLVSSDIRIPRDVHATLVEVIEPRNLTLVFEPAGRARLPVAVRFEPGGIPDGQALKRRPEPSVPWVEVIGARSALARMDSVETVPLKLSSGEALQEHSLALEPPKGVQAIPAKVLVRTDLEPRVVRHLGRYRVEMEPGARRIGARLEPDSVSLTVSGAASSMQSVSPQRIRVLAGPWPSGGRARKLPLRAVLGGLPPGAVVAARIQPDSVRVTIP